MHRRPNGQRTAGPPSVQPDSLQQNVVDILRIGLVANPLHGLEFIRRLERPVVLAMLDNSLRGHRTYTIQFLRQCRARGQSTGILLCRSTL